MRKRTNIVIEMDHVEAIMRRYGYRTMTEAVDHALRALAHRSRRRLTKDELLALQGKIDVERLPDPPPIQEWSFS